MKPNPLSIRSLAIVPVGMTRSLRSETPRGIPRELSRSREPADVPEKAAVEREPVESFQPLAEPENRGQSRQFVPRSQAGPRFRGTITKCHEPLSAGFGFSRLGGGYVVQK